MDIIQIDIFIIIKKYYTRFFTLPQMLLIDIIIPTKQSILKFEKQTHIVDLN